jgi:hypothetical protein
LHSIEPIPHSYGYIHSAFKLHLVLFKKLLTKLLRVLCDFPFIIWFSTASNGILAVGTIAYG